jgi:membrane protein
MANIANGRPGEERSVAQLINDASEQISRLVRDEMRLAAVELRRKGKRVGAGAGLLGAAAVLGWFGGATLVACAVMALALVVPAWLAALIVAAVILALAGVLALVGKKQVQRGLPPVPNDAITNVKQDVEAVKEGLHR